MIEEPALITIHNRQDPPSDSEIRSLAGFPTGFIADAMHGRGALSPQIKSVHTDLPSSFAGRALTCFSGPDDVLGLLAGLSEIRPGDVLMVACEGWQGSAAAGDRVIGMAKNAGAVGLVTDGLVRDVLGIVDVGIGVYATGVCPNSPVAKGPGIVGAAVSMGGVTVNTDDVIVADVDGVVVIPKKQVPQVIETVKHIEQLELTLDEAVANGLKIPQSITELLESDQVVRL